MQVKSQRKKGTRRRKKCYGCGDLFKPNCRTKGEQCYCSKEVCQKKRQRANEKDWRKRNKEKQNEYVRKWNKKNPGYSRKRRSENPKIVQKNRAQTRERMQKMRAGRLFDKSKLIGWQLTGNKEDKYYLARGGRWLFLRLTKASPFTRGDFMRHNCDRISRVSNVLPKGKIYELS